MPISVFFALTEPSDPPLWVVLMIPVLFLVGFASLWCLVCWINSRMTGWSRLANRFPASEIPRGRRHSLLARVGYLGRDMALTFVEEEEGIYLAMTPVFAFGHRPIFLPWKEFHSPGPALGLFRRRLKLGIGNPEVGVLVIPESFFKDVFAPRIPARGD